jgi:small-conductance mechanosensitive channel
MNFLKKIGFRKMDEMEMCIQLQAIRWTHLYIIAFLLIWMIYNYFTNQDISIIALLLSSSTLLQFIGVNLMKKRVDDDTAIKTKRVVIEVIIIFAIISILTFGFIFL